MATEAQNAIQCVRAFFVPAGFLGGNVASGAISTTDVLGAAGALGSVGREFGIQRSSNTAFLTINNDASMER